MDSEVEDLYLSKYYHVSREELDRIKEDTRADFIEFKLQSKHEEREKERIYGRPALNPGPLVHVLSVYVHREGVPDKPLSIHGTIIAENCDSVYGSVLRHDLYGRKRDNPEIIHTSGFLSLSGPDYMSHPDRAFIPMFKNKIVVKLYDGDNKTPFAQHRFTLNDTKIEGGYQKFKSRRIKCNQGYMLVNYVAIPFGVNCRIEVKFHSRKDGEKPEFINVNGKVAASFKDPYGDYNSEECVLFQTQSNSFESVAIDSDGMQLSRCWVAMPAYSSLVLHLNLSDESGRELVNDATFLPQQGSFFGKLFKLDGLYIQVFLTWFSPSPLRPHDRNNVILSKNPMEDAEEEMDIDEYDTTFSDDDTSLDDKTPSTPFRIKHHKKVPQPSPAFEIYSVVIGLEKSNAGAMQINGSIEVLLDGKIISISILKRDESKAFAFLKNMNFMPIVNGSGVYKDAYGLEIKLDLKDADDRLAIRGRMVYGGEELDGTWYRDKQLCCFIKGRGGFAAVHYSIFESALAAKINVFLNIKNGGGCPMICGSIFSQYRNYYYGSRYHNDCYRSALFVRNKDDSVQLNVDKSIPLSRSYVVVPTYSPLVINVDLSSSVLGCTEEIEIEIGEAKKTVKARNYSIRIKVEWCEVNEIAMASASSNME